MLSWLSVNQGTITVVLALGLVVCAIVRSMLKDKKAGKSTCGCGCANCAMSGACHKSD